VAHPLGHGRDSYFWALIASIGVFVAGAMFSIGQGILELLHPDPATSFAIAYVVLALAVVLDSISLIQAVRELRREAESFNRDVLEEVMLTSDPTLRAVFAEDVAAILGDVIAFLGVLLHQLTGSSAPDGLAAISIGLVLAAIGIYLAGRNRDFLLGQQASPALRQPIADFIIGQRGVTAVHELLVTVVGPHRVWVIARIGVDDALSAPDVESLVRDTEVELKCRSELIGRVDLVPIATNPPDSHEVRAAADAVSNA
jgi:cation diffusion facilitator family transporter